MTKEQILTALKDVIDPELGINVVDLGLVYDVDMLNDEDVQISMTMTTPACPLHAHLTAMAEAAVREHIPEAKAVQVLLVWNPPWSPEMMSYDAQRQLGFAK